jgi:hypothetical protein
VANDGQLIGGVLGQLLPQLWRKFQAPFNDLPGNFGVRCQVIVVNVQRVAQQCGAIVAGDNVGGISFHADDASKSRTPPKYRAP